MIIKRNQDLYTKKSASIVGSNEYSEPIVAASSSSKSLRRFTPPLSSGRSELTQLDREIVNARADYIVRNDGVGAAIASRLCDYVIGNGLNVKPCINFKQAGISREEALDLQEMFAADFDDWASSKESDFMGELSFYQAQYLSYFLSFSKGEIFFNIPHEMPLNFQEVDISLRHQIIDPDRVSNNNNAIDRKDLISGMALDTKGRVIGYWITDKHPGDLSDFQGARTWQFYPTHKEGQRFIYHHVKRKKKVDALRGLSIFAAILDRIFDLKRYRQAEIRTAIKQSNMFLNYQTDEEHSILEDKKKEEEFYLKDGEVGAFGDTTIIETGLNDKVELLSANHPHSNYVPFTDDTKKEIGAAIGVPHQVLQMLFDASFSASKAAITQLTEFSNIERGDFAPVYCKPHYQRFIDEKVALGDYKIKNYNNRRVRNAITKARWEGKVIGAIDEQKQAQAAKIRLESGITSKRIERERMGFDSETVEQHLDQEHKIKKRRRGKSEPAVVN